MITVDMKFPWWLRILNSLNLVNIHVAWDFSSKAMTFTGAWTWKWSKVIHVYATAMVMQ